MKEKLKQFAFCEKKGQGRLKGKFWLSFHIPHEFHSVGKWDYIRNYSLEKIYEPSSYVYSAWKNAWDSLLPKRKPLLS